MTVEEMIDHLVLIGHKNALPWLRNSLIHRQVKCREALVRKVRSYKTDPMKTACDVLNTIDEEHMDRLRAAILYIEAKR